MKPKPARAFANARLRHHANRRAAPADAAYPEALRRHFSLAATAEAAREMAAWRGYRPTPLVELRGVADEFELGAVYYKDESARFGLGSFKALGGAFAVLRLLQRRIFAATGEHASASDLEGGGGQRRHRQHRQHRRHRQFRAIAAGVTVVTATDGNHGRSVAWGAARFGCACRIYIHAGVSAGRAQAMRDLGAEVTRIRGDYDQSVRLAAAHAAAHGWHLVADTSRPDDLEMPATVMAGYSVMLAEIAAQAEGLLAGAGRLGESSRSPESPAESSPSPESPSSPESLQPSPPSPESPSPELSPSPARPLTHVFVQGGVGGLAAAVAAYLWERCGARRPRFIVVEPELAACLLHSAQQGNAAAVHITEETLMAGLSCGEASALAWEALGAAADDFLTIADDLVAPTMRLLARAEPPIEAGESAVAGLAAAIAARANPPLAATLDLDARSRILVFGTEGATDPEIYRKLVG